MATRQQHLKQWEHNRSFLASILRQPASSDWMTTVAFYTALHAVQVLLVADNHTRAVDHASRNRILIDDRKYLKIWPDYKLLYDASRAARYDCSGWLDADRVRDELVKDRLVRLEQSVVRLAKLPVTLPDLFATPYSDQFGRIAPPAPPARSPPASPPPHPPGG